jgi:hypothetical protein
LAVRCVASWGISAVHCCSGLGNYLALLAPTLAAHGPSPPPPTAPQSCRGRCSWCSSIMHAAATTRVHKASGACGQAACIWTEGEALDVRGCTAPSGRATPPQPHKPEQHRLVMARHGNRARAWPGQRTRLRSGTPERPLHRTSRAVPMINSMLVPGCACGCYTPDRAHASTATAIDRPSGAICSTTPVATHRGTGAAAACTSALHSPRRRPTWLTPGRICAVHCRGTASACAHGERLQHPARPHHDEVRRMAAVAAPAPVTPLIP